MTKLSLMSSYVRINQSPPTWAASYRSWLKKVGTKKLVQRLATETGIDEADLIFCSNCGTFVHPQIAAAYQESVSPEDISWRDCDLRLTIIYLATLSGSSFVKVGITNDVRHRVISLASQAIKDLSDRGVKQKPEICVLRTFEDKNAAIIEILMLKAMAGYRVRGEWFEMDQSVALGIFDRIIREYCDPCH
jgi:hypothetical protein